MHQVPPALRGARVIDPDQVCDALAVLSDADLWKMDWFVKGVVTQK